VPAANAALRPHRPCALVLAVIQSLRSAAALLSASGARELVLVMDTTLRREEWCGGSKSGCVSWGGLLVPQMHGLEVQIISSCAGGPCNKFDRGPPLPSPPWRSLFDFPHHRLGVHGPDVLLHDDARHDAVRLTAISDCSAVSCSRSPSA